MKKRSPTSKTDRGRLHKTNDAEIEANALSDPDNPPVSAAFLKKMIVVHPDRKTLVSLRLDTDVLAWFKQHGKGYQTRINAVLRAYVAAHKK